MNGIRVLDCTLRDGGRIFDCQFSDDDITGIECLLRKAGIDIIELGFLRNGELFEGNSTFFYDVNDTDRYTVEDVYYTLFIDHGLYDIDKLKEKKSCKISGIRYGFTRKDYCNEREIIIKEMKAIKALGYDLFVQDVNSVGYSTEELLKVLQDVNDIRPVSFGIVDTYGAMYLDDLAYIWGIVDRNLNKEISVDFHSHDNMEMSFALCQQLLSMKGKRNIIIDATLNGMGKGAGNLKTELIVDYLSRKQGMDYHEDDLLDAVDRYITKHKSEEEWGYSIPTFLSGIYQSHPNNVRYLTDKYRLNNREIKYILSEIDSVKRQRYDYDNINRIYSEYVESRCDDSEVIETLGKYMRGKKVLIIAPGASAEQEKDKINEYISSEKPIVISVNYIFDDNVCDYYFFANTIHWEMVRENIDYKKCILTSNIRENSKDIYMIDYSSHVFDEGALRDNSVIMLMLLLQELNVEGMIFAGFDGLRINEHNYYTGTKPNIPVNMEYDAINKEVRRMFEDLKRKMDGNISLRFLTHSLYQEM